MSDPEQKITRAELHNWVWTRPFVRLAGEIGYSYFELAAICEDLNIPRPSGGYWNRLERGLAEIQEPLPPAPPGKSTHVPFGKRKDAAPSAQEATEPKAVSGEKAEQNSDVSNPMPAKEAKPQPEVISPPKPIVSQSNESQPEKKPVARVYTREQLYEAIWTTPCVKLATELGISDVALAKTCRRLGIPRPPRGHWARVAAGEKTRSKPLPAAMPGQNTTVTFHVVANLANRQQWAANHLLTAAWAVKCDAVELPPEGNQLHPIAEKHRQALEKAGPGELDFVSIKGKTLFACDMTVALVPRFARVLHALLCELEDRDYEFKAGNSEHEVLQIFQDRDEITLNFSEEKLESEREPTVADKRKPSWTWHLKEVKPSGKLSVEVSAWGLKGKRRWTEDDGRSIEEVLAVVVDKIEAVFYGYEDRRLREAELASQRAEQAKLEAEAEAIEAEKQAKAEKARKECERIKKHEAKLDEIAGERRDNLLTAAQQWSEAETVMAYIQTCELKWAQAGALTKEQSAWLAWARAQATKMNPFTSGYPDPNADGILDPSTVPVGGPYPKKRVLGDAHKAEAAPAKPVPPEVRTVYVEKQQPYPYWVKYQK